MKRLRLFDQTQVEFFPSRLRPSGAAVLTRYRHSRKAQTGIRLFLIPGPLTTTCGSPRTEPNAASVVHMSEACKPRPLPESPETTWIRAFLDGDRWGFDQLVLHFQDRVFNLCYRMLGDYDEASDCAQETFVKVYRSLGDFRFEASFSTWLCTIAANTCRNRFKSLEYRTRKKMVRIDPLAGPPNPGHASLELPDPAPSALDRLTRQEQEAALQQAIATLAEDHRTVVILRDIEGLSYEEIAKATGYPLGTVKSKLARARQRLCEQLKGVI